VGDDAYGPMLRDALSAAGADVSGVRVTDDVATGVALILVTPDGENSIVVASGANARVHADDVTAGFGGDVVVAVAQLEVPVEAVTALARQCLAAGARLVLNAAPPEARLSAEVLRVCDPLVVNAHEASALTGAPVADSVQTARSAAEALLRGGCRSVVLTLGSAGAVVLDGSSSWHVAAPPVDRVVDTTGAGDCLVGTLAARLAAGDDLPTATADAVRTATLAVQRAGAQPSYVTREVAIGVPPTTPVPLGGTRGEAVSSNAL
jgi:ribokinase